MHRTSSWTLFALSALAVSVANADDVLIKTRDGATLSATLALPQLQQGQRLSAVLVFDIYSNPESLQAQAEELAARGYAGIVADVRGKHLSPDPIVPYEHDA